MNTARWIRHFHENTRLNATLGLPERCDLLPETGRRAVAASLAVFQLGESGGGTRLLRWHARCKALRHVSGLEEALRAFIAEEQGHAALLARVLDHLQEPPMQKQWTNSVFRWLRNVLNLEFNMQVLLTAELIAELYYGQLRLRCRDSVVRTAAGKILHDEMQHLAFQREFLTERLRSTSPLFRSLWRLQFRFIHAVTSRVVAWDHRHCLRTLGLTPREFFRRGAAARRHFERRLEKQLATAAVPALPGSATPPVSHPV
ncbi:MAG: hypothetical protein ACKV19_17820 [Verrucomicrobiales bacterium]